MLDLPVVREAAHGVDGLVSQIVVGGSVVLDQLREKRKHMNSRTEYFGKLKFRIKYELRAMEGNQRKGKGKVWQTPHLSTQPSLVIECVTGITAQVGGAALVNTTSPLLSQYYNISQFRRKDLNSRDKI